MESVNSKKQFSLVIFLILFSLLSCESQTIRNQNTDLIYPSLSHLENKTSYSNKDLNSLYESCKKTDWVTTFYKDGLDSKTKDNYCVCFVGKITYQLPKSELTNENLLNNLSIKCFNELGIYDNIYKSKHSKPDTKKYENKVQSELLHLEGVNGWKDAAIISIHENCITNQFMKNEFIEYSILSEFNNYCICLTESFVYLENPKIMLSDKLKDRIDEYSDLCLKPYFQINKLGWGTGDIKDLKEAIEAMPSWNNIAKKNNIPIKKLCDCMVDIVSSTIEPKSIAKPEFAEKVVDISTMCIEKLKTKKI